MTRSLLTAMSRRVILAAKAVARSRRTLLICWVILAATIVSYIPAIRAGFIWDDDNLLWRSETMHSPGGLRTIWGTLELPDYYPVTWSSLWVEWQIWGDSAHNALYFHLSNVVQQAIAAILLWRVLAALKIPGALLAALIFAVHPVNVASVAWVIERKNTISIIFYLLTVLWYLRYDRAGRPAWSSPWYYAAVGAFIVGLLCKTSIVILPAVLVGCMWWRRRRIAVWPLLGFVMLPTAMALGTYLWWWKHKLPFAQLICLIVLVVLLLGCLWLVRRRRGIRVVLDSLPFFMLATLASAASIWFQANRAIRDSIVRPEGWGSRMATAGAAVWFYIYKALVPLNLSMIYPHWQVNPSADDPASLLWLVPGLLLAAVFVVLIRHRRAAWGRPLLFAMSYFVVCLLPVLGFFDMFFFLYSLVADHWQHLAIIGVIALVVGASVRAIRHSPRWVRRGGAAVAGACVAVLALLILQQAYPQVNPTAEHLVSPDKYGPAEFMTGPYVLIFLALSLAVSGAAWALRKPLADTRNFATGVGLLVVVTLGALTLDKTRIYQNEGTLWHDTLPRNPTCWIAHYNLGTYLASTKRKFTKGLPFLRRAVKLNPYHESSLNNLGLTLYQIGVTTGNLELSREALPYFDRALAIKSYYPEAHLNKGLALAELGRLDEAIEHYRTSLRYKPGSAQAYFGLGRAFEAKGNLKEAADNYLFATRAKPDLGQAHYLLGAALFRIHKKQPQKKLIALAEEHLRVAVRLMPENAKAALHLGLVLNRRNKLREAVKWYRKALQLRGGAYAEPHNNLGIIFAQINRFPEAAYHFEQVLRLNRRHPQAWNNYGLVRAKMGRHEHAIRCYLNALQIKPRYSAAHYNMALSLIQMRRLKEAAEQLEKALRIDPKYTTARNLLKELTEMMNKPSGGAATRPAPRKADNDQRKPQPAPKN